MSMIRLTASGPPKRSTGARSSSYEGSVIHGWKIGPQVGKKRVGLSTNRVWSCTCVECGATAEKTTAHICRMAAFERDGHGQGGCKACRIKRNTVPDEQRKCFRCGCRTFRNRGDSAVKCKSCMKALARERQRLAVSAPGEKKAAS